MASRWKAHGCPWSAGSAMIGVLSDSGAVRSTTSMAPLRMLATRSARIAMLVRSFLPGCSGRHSHRRVAVDRGGPLRPGFLGPYDAVVASLEFAGDRPPAAVGDRYPVDRDDRQQLGHGAAEEDLVGDVQLSAVDLAPAQGQAQVRAGQVGDCGDRYPLKRPAATWRRQQFAVPDYHHA